MLRDRLVLMEQELVKQVQACGQFYKKIMLNEANSVEVKMYDSMKTKLADMNIEIEIVKKMIADGNP